MPTLVHLQQLAAQTDHTEIMSSTDFEQWFATPELKAEHNVFVATDDDESNRWGQAETLEGIEGEVVGYTVVQLRQNAQAAHFLCVGTVHPQHRQRGIGLALLICALNRARFRAVGLMFAGKKEPMAYFEAALPLHDSHAEHLAAKCDLIPTDEEILPGMRLYRSELWY